MLITQKEARKILGVSAPTFRVMRDEGQIKPRRVGKRDFYDRDEIRAFKKEGTTHARTGKKGRGKEGSV